MRRAAVAAGQSKMDLPDEMLWGAGSRGPRDSFVPLYPMPPAYSHGYTYYGPSATQWLHCTALHCTALHCTALHCVVVDGPTVGATQWCNCGITECHSGHTGTLHGLSATVRRAHLRCA
jgi:hypothetical protein